jgi:hypothetical protein
MLPRLLSAFGVFATLVLLVPSSGIARDVKRCGITVAAGKTARLVKDVQCGWRCTNDPRVRCRFGRENNGCPLIGDEPYRCTSERILLEPNATLELNGFTLTAVEHGVGIVCVPGGHAKCTVKGGTFAARRAWAFVPNYRDLVLEDLVVKNAEGVVLAGRISATNVFFEDSTASMRSRGGVRIRNFRIAGGVYSDKGMFLDVAESTDGFTAAGAIRGSGVIVSNGVVYGKSVHLRDSRVERETIDPASFEPAVIAYQRLFLRDSVVGTILSGDAPRLKRATCTESRKIGGEESWGVCTND